MLSLIYVSAANKRLTMAKVEELAERAARANAERGVTGLLAYNSANFMQLLEGEGGDVLATMRKIERDPRHSNITYIRQDIRAQRECPDWSMRQLITPLSGVGSAKIFTGSLPENMEMDTRILFTSFASSLRADHAANLLEQEAQVKQSPRIASND